MSRNFTENAFLISDSLRQESDNSLPEDMELKLSPMEAAARAGRQQQLEQLPQIQQQSSEMAGKRDWTQLYESAIKYGVPLKKVNQVRQLAEMFGSKVEFYSSEDLGEHGFRSPDGILHINANSQNPVAQIFGHELTHSLEKTGSYGKLQQLVFDRITETGGDLEKMREEKRADYAEQKVVLDDQGVDREITAAYMENLLTDEAAIRSLVRGDKKIGQRFLDWIDRILAKLGNENAQERAFLARARQMYSAALQENREAASKTRQETSQQLAETDSLGERTQLPISEEAYSGKDLSQDKSLYTYEFLTALPDMQTVTLAELPDVRNENGRIETAIVMEKGMKNALSNGYEQDGMVFVRNNYTGRPLRITAECIRHGLNGKANRLITNARLCAVIGDVIKNAVPINALHNKAKDVTGTYAMAAYATDSDGREFVVVATIEQHNDKVSEIEVFDTVHAVSGRQKRGGQASEPHTSSRAKTLSNLSSISISDFLDIVKNTHQSLLSEDVLAHFGEVRNPEGQYTKDAKFSISTEQPAETEYDSPEDVPEAKLPTFPADENSYDPQDLHNWGDLRELELPMFNPEDAPYIPGREPKELNDSADLRELQLPMFLADEESNGPDGENQYSFGGEHAKKRDQSMLETAIALEAKGENNEAIRRETGWFRGMDGKWRFEIDDSRMKLKNFDPDKGADKMYEANVRYAETQMKMLYAKNLSKEQRLMIQEYIGARRIDPARAKALYQQLSESSAAEVFREIYEAQEEYDAAKEKNMLKLGDVITHPTLFQNYPALRKVPVSFTPTENLRGSNGSTGIWVSRNLLRNPWQLSRTLLHEIQHEVQRIEGFALGSNPEHWEKKIQEGYSRKWAYDDQEMDSWDLYSSTAGEIEARNVSDRMPLSPEKRTEILPDLGDENTVFAEDDGQNTLWAEEKGVEKPGETGIIEMTADDVPIDGDNYIEARNQAVGKPAAIVHFDTALNKRQQKLLDSLPEFDSRVIVPKDSVNLTDLSALTAKTGDEFAVFTKGGKRLIVRGNPVKVNIVLDQAQSLAEQGYKWTGHTHPGITKNSLIASKGDVEILKCFAQDSSVVYNSAGDYRQFWKE